jgi:prepilin-type processing-associated H-X9-DG protein
VIDWQAPRNAYTLNEALCPRGLFQLQFGNRGNNRIYRFVQAARVKNSGQTILATELSGIQSLVRSTSLVDNSTPVSGSRRPVNGYDGSAGGRSIDEPYTIGYSRQIPKIAVTEIGKDPEANAGGTPLTLLDFVGRNHGRKRLDGKGYDVRVSNFLYLDGHVETKSVLDTVRTTFEWGEKFYTLEK